MLISILTFFSLPMVSGGIIRKVRAMAQGRKGPSILQNMFDVSRMMRKAPIDGPNSGIFAEISPVLALLSALLMWSVVCFEWAPFLVIPFFLALEVVALMTFACETGTSFGGLGSSRQLLLMITAKPLLILIVLVMDSVPQISNIPVALAVSAGMAVLGLIAMLAELARPPFDDPRTHLELTMVHEAMLLEASGRTLGFFELANQVKIAALLTLVAKIALKQVVLIEHLSLGPVGLDFLLVVVSLSVATVIGFWEAISVRRKWTWVPEILGLAFAIVLLLGTLIKINQ